MKLLQRASCRRSLCDFVGVQVRGVVSMTGHDRPTPAFIFSPENFRRPDLPNGLKVRDIVPEIASDDTLAGLGRLVHDPEDFTVAGKTFEITKWPQLGWRPLDPGTGDEAGTTEGDFEVQWQGDFFYGKNLAIATENNEYLDGLGALPELAETDKDADASSIHLWMSDYHPDGGQLFWPRQPIPFSVCLGPASRGDDIKPEDMRAFHVPAGKGVYIHPGTWHNGIYVAPRYTAGAPARFLTRQGRVKTSARSLDGRPRQDFCELGE